MNLRSSSLGMGGAARGKRGQAEQLELFRHGGRRAGAGRKLQAERPQCSHKSRSKLATRFPVLVTIRLRAGLPSLRSDPAWRVLLQAIQRASMGTEFRVVHASAQTNHVHLIVEARDSDSLASGMCGLLVRVARGWNRIWRRHGTVFADRYHSRPLRTPREVRSALVYVLHNTKKHCAHAIGVDPFSSGPWFDGWREVSAHRDTPIDSPFPSPSTWLLRHGWLRHGLIGVTEAPVRIPLPRKGAQSSS